MMSEPKSIDVIKDKLAYEAPITIYRLNKITGYSTSTIHASMQNLMKQNLVKKDKKGYIFSLIGLMNYFIQKFTDKKFDRQEIRRVVQKYASIVNFPLIAEYRFLEKWLEDEYYDLLVSAAYITNAQFRSSISVIWMKAPRPIERGERVPLPELEPELEELEETWKQNYALSFFKLTITKPDLKITPPANDKIRELIKEVFQKEILAKEKNLDELRNHRQKLLNHQL